MPKKTNFEPKDVLKFKRNLRKKVNIFTAVLNLAPGEEFRKLLSGLLSPHCSLSFTPLKHKVTGLKKVVSFWEEQRKKGLSRLKLTIEDMVIEPIKKTEVREGRSLNFNARALIIGKYSYFIQRTVSAPTDPSGSFFLELAHQDDCPWEFEKQFFS